MACFSPKHEGVDTVYPFLISGLSPISDGFDARILSRCAKAAFPRNLFLPTCRHVAAFEMELLAQYLHAFVIID